ncbi:hypothetical protein VULLAG_LOCUS16493 [Vulpes lagopus]
MAGCNMPHCWY